MLETAVNVPLAEKDQATAQEFSGRLFMAGLNAMELGAVNLGLRLGLYTALHQEGPLTSTQVGARSGVAERYAREWLEQQAAMGVLEVDDVGAAAEERRYALPPAHAHVLLDEESPMAMGAMAALVRLVGRVEDKLVEAYRAGKGVPYEDYEAQDMQAAFTRPVFASSLVQEWLPALPRTLARLQSDPPARVAEIGCGCGWAAISLGRAFPKVRVDAYDVDAGSIERAWKNSAAAAVSDRVRFERRDVARDGLDGLVGRYDLVFCVEMLHDVADPVGVLRTMRRLAAPTGEVLVVDEKAAESFAAPADELNRFFYAASVLHCLPVGMVEEGSAATGTVIRPDTLRRYAFEAGFREVDVLPVEHMQFRLYQLVV